MKHISKMAAYFTITWKDRVAIVVLTCIILLVSFAPRLFPPSFSPIRLTAEDSAWLDVATSSEKSMRGNAGNTNDEFVYEKSVDREIDRTAMVFSFDPNTLDAGGWKKLGLRDRTIQTILNYRNKGGRFRDENDLSKIWGLSVADFKRLRPYVKIEAAIPSEAVHRPATVYISTKKTISPVDINSADTTAFIALPGIGSKLAARIVLFREKLGGFHQVSQVSEVYGLHDSVYQKIFPYLIIKSQGVKKININTATLEELKAHPYIKYILAKPIVAYRNEHGFYKELTDLKKVSVITSLEFEKMLPYISL